MAPLRLTVLALVLFSATTIRAQQGDIGATGPMGYPGYDGPQGGTGATGPSGRTGATGATGFAGSPGRTGATGASLNGPPGATGAMGATGAQGPPGDIIYVDNLSNACQDGRTGEQGLPGRPGRPGPPGAPGLPGPPATAEAICGCASIMPSALRMETDDYYNNNRAEKDDLQSDVSFLYAVVALAVSIVCLVTVLIIVFFAVSNLRSLRRDINTAERKQIMSAFLQQQNALSEKTVTLS